MLDLFVSNGLPASILEAVEGDERAVRAHKQEKWPPVVYAKKDLLLTRMG